MINQAQKQAIIAAVDAGFEQQIAFTQSLVRLPSVRGQEEGAQTVMAKALSERGYSVDRWAIDIDQIKQHPGFSPVTVDYSKAINVVASHTPSQTPKQQQGRSLICCINAIFD